MSNTTPSRQLPEILNRLRDLRAEAAEETSTGLLAAVWSFLRHPTVPKDRVTDVEETQAGRSRLVAAEGRLQAVRTRVIGELKAELRGAIRILILGAGAGLLALVGAIYILMGTWLTLRGLVGAVAASFTMGVGFIVLSLVILIVLPKARRR